jgi:drug/metabolite transporter (DMT)-like permease
VVSLELVADAPRMMKLLSGELMQGERGRRIAMILLFVAPALFASNMLTARATADFIPPIALAFWRWTLALLLLLLLCGGGLWRKRLVVLREWKDLLLLGALGMGVCGAFVYIGADTTTATNIGLIYAASPVLILLIARYGYGEAMAPGQLFGVACALLGVVAIVCRGDIAVLTGLAFTVGDLWVVAATSAWAVYSVLLRHRPSRLGAMERFAAITLGGVLVLLPFHLGEAASGQLPAFDVRTLATVGFLALVASFAAYQVYGLIQTVLGAGRTGLLMYLIPVYNSLLAVLLLGETFETYHALGGLLVLAGLLLATRLGPRD